MSFYVVAYPRLAAADLRWIEDYRSANDHRFASVIRAHFTLVFNISNLDKDAICREIERQCEGQKPIEFELAIATINKDYFGNYHHEFLVPEKGYAALVRLHDRLYSGALKESLNLNIDFIPHIGIGNTSDSFEAKARVDRLNEAPISIPGVVERLDIVSFADNVVSTVHQVSLL